MGREIERKFLVKPDFTYATHTFKTIRQGYLSRSALSNVRVRVADTAGYLTIKSKGSTLDRAEYEYEIPLDEANELLETLCAKPILEKRCYAVLYMGYHWEVDCFLGENEGLVLAELELENENDSFPKPPWLEREVTDDERYYNANLVENPYRKWT